MPVITGTYAASSIAGAPTRRFAWSNGFNSIYTSLGGWRLDGGSSPSLAALALLGAGAGHTTLSPTPLRGIGSSRAPKQAALSLGLPSYPP